MKTTKKILSVILAVMLLVGTVVVGVNADTTMVYEKAGSKLVYTATTDKTANENGVIELTPGETVTVSVYAQANYYLGTTGSEIFCWTAGFFNTITVDNVATHNFVNNYTLTKKVIASTSATQLGTGYNKGTHEGYYNSRAYTTDCTSPYDASTATLAYTFTFTVPETATVGATGEFRMPETCSATVATSSRMRQIYAAVNNSATAYGSTSLGSEYPETIDLTGTILNFKVVSAAVLGEITNVTAYPTPVGDTAIVTVDVTGSPEALRVVTPSGEKTLSRDDTSISVEATESGETWTIEVLAEAETNNCTVYADYGAAGETAGTAFVVTGIGYCSYTLLETAVLYCSELDADEDYYDPTDLQTWKNALATAEALLADKDTAPLVKSDENQATLDNAANALTEAYDNLYEIYLDLKPLRDAVSAYSNPEKAPEFYDADAYIAWQDALAAAREALIDYDAAPNTAANQAAVAALASDLETKYKALVPQYVNLDALNKAVADCAAPEKAEEYYDAAAYAAWEAALAAAKAGLTTYAEAANTAANQAAVANLATDLETKFNALVPQYVNLDALTQAVADYAAPEKAEEYYDATEYAAWEAALAAAKAGLTDYAEAADTAANQAAVAALASDLKAAYEELDARYIDYSALEEAVKNYGTTPEAADAYTTETYDPYAAALARANEMLANKVEAPASDTALAAQIAAAASELETTYNALELVPVNAIITSVTAKQEFYKVGDTVSFDFVCSVTDVAKIQIVYDNGTTLTYHRGHSAVSVADNGDGTETWTIATKIYYDEATATAKAKLGKVWENGGYEFDVKTSSDEDYSVKSAEVLLNDVAVTEFTTNDTVVLKIVCGPSTLRMRLVDQANGATSTFSRSKATQDENGNWVWLITRKAGAGAYAYDIYTTGEANRLTDEGTDLTYTVTAPVVVNGPSTGEDADIVISATVAKKRVLRGNEQTFTIVTDKDAKGVRVMDQYGVVQTYSKDVATAIDNGDNTLTWVITTACGHADSYTCTVEALYGSAWMSNGTTVAYSVAY